MNLHLLRMFHAVVRNGSVSSAAQELHVSQPAVSRALRELESQLNLPLLERDGGNVRGIRLTEHGEALHAHAKGIFALERAAEQDVQQRVSLDKGTVHVAASTTVAAYWLPSYLALFRQAHPNVTCSLQVGNTDEVGHWLLDCSSDIGIVEGSLDDPRLHIQPWKEDAMVLVAVPDDPLVNVPLPVRHQALQDAHWLLRERGSGTRTVTEQFWQARGLSPHHCTEIASGEAIARLVAAGFGIALQPRVLVSDLLQLQALAPVAFPSAQCASSTHADTAWVRKLHVLELRDRPDSPALRAFKHLLWDSDPCRTPDATPQQGGRA